MPFFFHANLTDVDGITLDEDNSRHAVQVLRMQKGEALILCDGKGTQFTGIIAEAHKKQCSITISSKSTQPPPFPKAIAISPLKNPSRFEWFIEKAVELGITDIFPILCQRTEKQHIRLDRLQQICKSAMLQSQQSWLCQLHPAVELKTLFSETSTPSFNERIPIFKRFALAHCYYLPKMGLANLLTSATLPTLVLIGPEGDFTLQEVEMATAKNTYAVDLGATRLRTETAGLTAAVLLAQLS